jgi:hypothetical protein
MHHYCRTVTCRSFDLYLGRRVFGINNTVSRGLNVLLWLALTVLVLAGLYVSMHASLSASSEGGARSRLFRLSVSALRPGKMEPVFDATQGDTVTLVIWSDSPGAAHLHGYEKEVELKPGSEVSLTLITKDAGLFPLHLHGPNGSMSPLAALDVQPR